MLEDVSFIGFIVAALIVLTLPGPGVMYVVARSISQGVWAGLASVVGLSLGAFFHVIAATIGLSTLLLSSALAFSMVKYAGAMYLIYLGLQTIFAKRRAVAFEAPPDLPIRRLVTDGVIVSVFNPKIAVFFLAFLPQFVEPRGETAALQVFVLGIIYVALALVTDGAYALMASGARRVLAGRMSGSRVPRLLSGSVYLSLGVTTAFSSETHGLAPERR